MTTIVKAANAAQFLSLVPKMLGYRPTRSVVLIPFAGSRSIGAMRFDLPDATESDEIDRIAATLIGMVCRLPDADAVAAVAYTDAALRRRGHAAPRPHRGTGAARRRLRYPRDRRAVCRGGRVGLPFRPRTARDAGRPLDELGDEPRGAEHLSIADGDQAAGQSCPRSTSPRRSARPALCWRSRRQCDCCAVRSGRRVEVAQPVRDSKSMPRHPVTTPPTVDAWTRRPSPRSARSTTCRRSSRTRSGGMPRRSRPFDAAALTWCLARPALRDIALVQWCGGMSAGDEALDAQLRWESGEEYPAHLAMQMWGEGERPDPDRLEAALALSRRVAAAAPRAVRAGPLATCGWLAWALGRSTHAERYATLACEIEPEHGLAEIVRSFVLAGHLPGLGVPSPSERVARLSWDASPAAAHRPNRRRNRFTPCGRRLP